MKLEKNKSYSKNKSHPLKLAIFGFLGTIFLIIAGFFLRSWLDMEIEQKVEKAVKKNYSLESENKNINSVFSTPKNTVESSILDGNFISGSFSDTFSGSGWLGGMSLYQDRYTTGLTPYPKFELSPIKGDFFVPDKSFSCPQGMCFSVSGKNLYSGGSKIDLPNFSGTLVSVEVVPLEDSWILGITSEDNEVFKGWVYSFIGERFSSVSGALPVFESRYRGNFDFVGNSSRWLVFYGSYEGKVFSFSKGKLKDFSYLVNARVMRNGFMPKVFSFGNNWLVSNLVGGFPLLHFFSNSNGEIIGSLDLTDLIDEKFSEDLRNLKVVESGEKIFLELTGPSGVSNWFEFVDNGFFYPEKSEIISSNLRINQPQSMARARFLEARVYPEGIQPRFFLANSNGTWQSALIGEWVYFPKEGKELYWRADFSGIKTPFFFDLVKIEYGLNP
jgi:hypothetical protein